MRGRMFCRCTVCFVSPQPVAPRSTETYFIDKLLYLRAQFIFAIIPLHNRESLIEALCGGATDVCDEIREILWSLQLDFALDLRDDGFRVHV